MRLIKQKIDAFRHRRLTEKVHTELDLAVTEILKRREDTKLVAEIELFLENDIPSHFLNKKPIFYLSRYIATPDYETLFFIDQVKKYNFPIIIGEDTSDILTSHSTLKRNLLKLPIITGESKHGNGIIRHERVADLNTEQGKQLRDVELLNGQSLVDLHHKLCNHFFSKQVQVVSESDWVDRHSRGKLISLYENMLALLITHGIMCEFYEVTEIDFLAETVIPAMNNTKKRFGFSPLIVPLEQKKSRKIKDYNSYPSTTRLYLQDMK